MYFLLSPCHPDAPPPTVFEALWPLAVLGIVLMFTLLKL